MAEAARKLFNISVDRITTKDGPAVAADYAINVASPALALQQVVEKAYSRGHPQPYIGTWHPAVRAAFLAKLAGLSWAAVLVGARL